MTDQLWYKNGLKFECIQCGNCCSGVPGHVWVTEAEICQIANLLSINETEFRQRYIVNDQSEGPRLAERQNDDCVFYNNGHGCVIYECRPRQCQTWPFWRSNLASPKSWGSVATSCPGLNNGRHRTADQIAAIIENDGLPEK